MDNPIFKLEGVVHERSAETLQDFEGPLDLILFLLSKNKIEIQDIPIALILEQYLAYLEQRKQLDLEVTDAAKTYIADNGYDPVYGARPLKRFIQSSLETMIAKKIIADDVAPYTTLTVDYENGSLILR